MEDMAMNEYIEMKWRRSGETVRVYGFSTVNIGDVYPDVRSYATVFSRSGKMQGGSGWKTVEVHELTPIEFYNKENPYERFEV
jgi:hypothetical protein